MIDYAWKNMETYEYVIICTYFLTAPSSRTLGNATPPPMCKYVLHGYAGKNLATLTLFDVTALHQTCGPLHHTLRSALQFMPFHSIMYMSLLYHTMHRIFFGLHHKILQYTVLQYDMI